MSNLLIFSRKISRLLNRAWITGKSQLLGLILLLSVASSVVSFTATAQELPKALRKGTDLTEFILNLARFTVWPYEVRRGQLSLCVVRGGGLLLDEAATQLPSGTSVGGQMVVVTRVTMPRETQGCHVLWINADVKPPLKEWLTAVRDLPVLTISDAIDFTADGGIVCAHKLDAQWRFEINIDALQRSGLKIAAAMLRLNSWAAESPQIETKR